MRTTLRHPYRALRRRMGRAAAIATLVLAVAAPAALAYYTILYLGASGSGTEPAATSGGTQGSASAATATVTWPASALAPGTSEPLQIDWKDNDPGDGVSISGVTAAVTTGASGCLAAWFVVSLAGGGSPSAVNPGNVSSGHGVAFASGAGAPSVIGGDLVQGPAGTITFTDSGTDQTVCEGVPITVTLTGTATPQ